MKKILAAILLIAMTGSIYAQAQSEIMRTPDEAKQRIGEIYNKLINGADFKTMAALYSEDPGSSKKGGEYDSITKGMFVPEFENVVFNLKLNEISMPFRTMYGFHIAQLIGINGEIRNVRHILIQCKK